MNIRLGHSISIFLQGTAAYLHFLRHLLVCQLSVTVHQWAVFTDYRAHLLVALLHCVVDRGNRLIVQCQYFLVHHSALDLVVYKFLLGKHSLY